MHHPVEGMRMLWRKLLEAWDHQRSGGHPEHHDLGCTGINQHLGDAWDLLFEDPHRWRLLIEDRCKEIIPARADEVERLGIKPTLDVLLHLPKR